MTAAIDPCLRRDLELGVGLWTTARHGAARLRDALDTAFRGRLLEEVASGPFTPATREVGEVRQEVEGFVLDPVRAGAYPLADRLRRELTERVQDAGAHLDGITSFDANQVHVQRYAPGSGGITPHLDGSRFRPLVAVFTVAGRARFTVHRERHGEPVHDWGIAPGDLVLLRGPGLGGVDDGRPFHAVSGALGDEPRYMVSIRRDAGAPIHRDRSA
ncbi:alpha-ketoglutarate-dependent dioxygenase AlkB [Egibacter rhizosphaerae]|uniref:alpha-ketoglutarate-dependent dioxygenase AlkB n=1 Tax=Egibacter rhizosphaerae TaxID=1670831 RepID=UPI0013F168F1|nr:alpha-ketoglutarate-dependent dioxygenase AlkB [Egibacter rhizosphaerae]